MGEFAIDHAARMAAGLERSAVRKSEFPPAPARTPLLAALTTVLLADAATPAATAVALSALVARLGKAAAWGAALTGVQDRTGRRAPRRSRAGPLELPARAREPRRTRAVTVTVSHRFSTVTGTPLVLVLHQYVI